MLTKPAIAASKDDSTQIGDILRQSGFDPNNHSHLGELERVIRAHARIESAPNYLRVMGALIEAMRNRSPAMEVDN